MSRVFLLQLDLNRIRKHMSEEEGREVSSAEVLAWLSDAGFVETSDGWEIPEKDLGQLRPDEVIEAHIRPPSDSP